MAVAKARTANEDLLLELSVKINARHRQVLRSIRKSVDAADEAGELLTEAKDLAGHGQFERWVNANCDFGIRTAQKYMRVFKHRDLLYDGLTLEQSLDLLSDSKATAPSLLPTAAQLTTVEHLELVSDVFPTQPQLPDAPLYICSKVADWRKIVASMPDDHVLRSSEALRQLRDYIGKRLDSLGVQ